jgi:hypothetical protein
LLAHAPYCSTPEALDLRADFEEESLAVRAAIQEIEFTLTTLPPKRRPAIPPALQSFTRNSTG